MKQRYRILDVQGPNYDTYPNNFKCWVYFVDLLTGIGYKRRGYGKFIGNFSPIWITLNKQSLQLTELERIEVTLEPTP